MTSLSAFAQAPYWMMGNQRMQFTGAVLANAPVLTSLPSIPPNTKPENAYFDPAGNLRFYVTREGFAGETKFYGRNNNLLTVNSTTSNAADFGAMASSKVTIVPVPGRVCTEAYAICPVTLPLATLYLPYYRVNFSDPNNVTVTYEGNIRDAFGSFSLSSNIGTVVVSRPRANGQMWLYSFSANSIDRHLISQSGITYQNTILNNGNFEASEADLSANERLLAFHNQSGDNRVWLVHLDAQGNLDTGQGDAGITKITIPANLLETEFQIRTIEFSPRDNRVLYVLGKNGICHVHIPTKIVRLVQTGAGVTSAGLAGYRFSSLESGRDGAVYAAKEGKLLAILMTSASSSRVVAEYDAQTTLVSGIYDYYSLPDQLNTYHYGQIGNIVGPTEVAVNTPVTYTLNPPMEDFATIWSSTNVSSFLGSSITLSFQEVGTHTVFANIVECNAGLLSLTVNVTATGGGGPTPPPPPLNRFGFEWPTAYPNPAKHRLTIKAAEPCALTIYSVQGQLIRRVACSAYAETEIDISALQNGIYFLAYDNGTAQHTEKFVVLH